MNLPSIPSRCRLPRGRLRDAVEVVAPVVAPETPAPRAPTEACLFRLDCLPRHPRIDVVEALARGRRVARYSRAFIILMHPSRSGTQVVLVFQGVAVRVDGRLMLPALDLLHPCVIRLFAEPLVLLGNSLRVDNQDEIVVRPRTLVLVHRHPRPRMLLHELQLPTHPLPLFPEPLDAYPCRD